MPQTIPPPPTAAGGSHANLFPSGGTGTGSVGTSGNKWNEVVATTVKSEDINMFRDNIRNTMIEVADGGLIVCDRNTGRFYRFASEECNPPPGWTPTDGDPVILPSTENSP